MKIKKATEQEREFRLFFTNEEGEEDDYTITFKYNEENKNWITNLSGEYEEKELEAVKMILKELNTMHKERIEINLESKK